MCRCLGLGNSELVLCFLSFEKIHHGYCSLDVFMNDMFLAMEWTFASIDQKTANSLVANHDFQDSPLANGLLQRLQIPIAVVLHMEAANNIGEQTFYAHCFTRPRQRVKDKINLPIWRRPLCLRQ